MLQCLGVRFEAETLVQTVLGSLGMHLRNRRQGVTRFSRCFQIAEMRIWWKAVLRIKGSELEAKIHLGVYSFVASVKF